MADSVQVAGSVQLVENGVSDGVQVVENGVTDGVQVADDAGEAVLVVDDASETLQVPKPVFNNCQMTQWPSPYIAIEAYNIGTRLALSPKEKKQFELKILAESIFKGKKNNYQDSVPHRFVDDRLSADHQTLRNTFMASPTWPTGEELVYSCEVVKYDRRGYKPRERALVVSNKAMYVLGASCCKTYKLKHRLPLEKLKVVVTNESDSLVLVKIPVELKKDKGDLIISVTNLIEALTIVADFTKKPDLVEIVDIKTLRNLEDAVL